MIKKFRTYFTVFLIFSAVTVFAQIGELNLSGLNNCIPAKNSEVINSVEQTYKDCLPLYNDGLNSNLSEQVRKEKLVSLFKIQISSKEKLNSVWQQSDSISKDFSKKYFEEATKSFKQLTDSIDLINPTFKSLNTALVVVEKSHQVIQLQKFGLQVLFGCVMENNSGLKQPSDSSGKIVINIDMVERFRKVWNEANYPVTYDKWVYVPAERKPFAKKSYAEIWKENKYVPKKEVVAVDTTNKNLNAQNALAVNQINNVDTTKKENTTIKTLDSNTKKLNTDKTKKGNTSNRTTGKKQNPTVKNDSLTAKGSKKLALNSGVSPKMNQSTVIIGEGKRLGINQNTQFEIKNITSPSRIKSLGIDYFTIQIAASKVPVFTEKLKKDYYCGNYDIEEKSEDGWYKYIIGRFSSIDSASKYLEKPCLVQGFVSGYNSKGRVAIFSIKQPIKSFKNSSIFSIVYRIQIAAAKQPLSKEILSTVYKGKNPINISQEDGWYRYSIGDYFYFDEARIARDSCGTTNAFVMPYQNGTRVPWPGKESLELLKVNQKESPIYVIQVAASRKPLPLDIISNIIKVDYPLTMKFEDGWYKYCISAFTDFAYAKQVADKIGIKGAFIATYKNGLRVNP